MGPREGAGVCYRIAARDAVTTSIERPLTDEKIFKTPEESPPESPVWGSPICFELGFQVGFLEPSSWETPGLG